jgi:lysophospholipase L1-like esterase
MNWETILCLGDSITIGSRSYLGYPEYCGEILSKLTNKHWNVINHATAGFTVIDLVRSIDKNFAHLKACKPELVSILIGTNDLKTGTSGSDFKIAYTQLIVKSRLLTSTRNIIVSEIPKLMSGVMLPYNIEMNQKVEEFNNVIKEIVLSEQIIIHAPDAQPNHFYDGVHLNDYGSEVWGKMLADKIMQLRM